MQVPYDTLEEHLKMNENSAPPPRVKTSKYFLTFSPNKRFVPNSPEANEYISKVEAAYDHILGDRDKVMQYIIILRSRGIPETDLVQAVEEKKKIYSIEGSRMGEQGMINNIVHLHALLSFAHNTLILLDYGRLRADFAKAVGEISVHFYSHVFSDKQGTIMDYIQKRIDYIAKGDMKQFAWLKNEATAAQATVPHQPVPQKTLPKAPSPPKDESSGEETAPIPMLKKKVVRQSTTSGAMKNVPFMLQGVVTPPTDDKPKATARALPPMRSTAAAKPKTETKAVPAKKSPLQEAMRKMKTGERLTRTEKALLMQAMMSDEESAESSKSESGSGSEDDGPEPLPTPKKVATKPTKKNPPPGKVWSSFFGDFIDEE